MNTYRISLIIPAYNEEKYIGACLEYALKNSSGHLSEIIVVDNGSSDRTREIAERYSGVTVVEEKVKGLTKARERGFKEATGDILAYIDADTHMPAQWCDTVLSEFSKNKKLVCLSGPYFYYDIPVWQQVLVKVYWYVLALPLYYCIGYMVVGGNFAIKKEVLEKMSGFDTSISFYGEDTDIARRAHRFGKVMFSPSFLMPTSGRRLAGEGLWHASMSYALNFLSEVTIHRPVTKEYTDIR